MDVTTGAIVLIFIISVFSGFGTNKGYHQPASSSSPKFPVETTTVSLTEPDPKYIVADAAATRSAIQNYICKYRTSDESAQIAGCIMKYSQSYDLNPKLAAALIARESKFNPRAVSSSGAVGLGQLLPSTAKGLNIDDPYDIDQNAKGTVRYIKSLVDRFNGKVSSAIASYLEGPNAVLKNGGYTDHTRSYVEDILTIYQKI
ncbi:MAG TPA: lytic transglycosylase domain-containing protein [Candidatus Sulfotelmatobacter sp.]|nr:lytic transglycosylase domain-containing protein [Candidatus Sulfotelmatobacter sp.]